MKHSHLVRVTRLSHPKEFEFAFAFGIRLGFAESPAEARRWGALQGTSTERPEVDFAFEFDIVIRPGHRHEGNLIP
jgi:hypothetical protein